MRELKLQSTSPKPNTSIPSRTNHAVNTLEKAIKYGIPEICNADQGSQFTSDDWISILTENAIKISHDGVGRFIDNIRIERFRRTIKYEDVHIMQYQNIKEARDGISAFIDYYNYERYHQALQYQKPAELFFAKKTTRKSACSGWTEAA